MATPPTFTAGNVLTAAQMNQIGVWHIGKFSAAGTATTWQISNVFTTDYPYYRIYFSGSIGTAAQINLQLTAGGVAATTSYYWDEIVRNYNAANTENNGNNLAYFNIGSGNTGTLLASSAFICDVTNPADTFITGFNSNSIFNTTSARNIIGTHYVANSYDGFKLTSLGGNFSGDIHIYGFTA